MNLEFGKLCFLLKRELIELRSPRQIVVFALFALLQFLTMANARQHGLIEDTTLIFLMGGLASLLVCFDLLAREREHHTLDLLLQGASRGTIYAAKWTITLLNSLACTVAFGLGTIGGTLVGRGGLVWGNMAAEFGGVFWLLFTYGLVALVASTIFRQGKWALGASAVLWVLLRPMVTSLVILGPLQSVFGWSKTQVWNILVYLPEFAFRLVLDPARAVPEGVTVPAGTPLAALAAYGVVLTLAAGMIFLRQDEPTR